MEKTITGGNDPAFGSIAVNDSGDLFGDVGLTKREYFATRAMIGLIAAKPNQIHNTNEGCELAVKWADQLIKELNQQ